MEATGAEGGERIIEMIGGTVITTIENGTRIYINVRENVKRGRAQTCAIYVERNRDSEQIRPGDTIWWQGKRAMWTPIDRRVVEKEIPRASYSGVQSPYAQRAA